jgi:hypothetical protein
MSDRRRSTVVRVSGGGGEVGASLASFAALVCAPQDTAEAARERELRELEALEQAVLLQLSELRARRARAARR